MEDHLLDRVDENDKVVGTIRQSRVFAEKANFRVVHILVFSPDGQLLLQRMRINHERYPGYWGSSAAGFVHSGETYNAAAKRVLKRELGIKSISLTKLGVKMVDDHGSKKFLAVYQCVADEPFMFDPLEVGGLDFVTMTEPGKIALEDRRTFTPTFRRLMIEFKPSFSTTR